MTGSPLVASTGTPAVDQLLRDLGHLITAEFPRRLRAIYVLGSHADGTAVPDSDADIVVLLRGLFAAGEHESLLQAVQSTVVSAPFRVDLTVSDEAPGGRARFIPVLKFGSLLAWGEDIRDRIELPAFDAYLRDTILSACWFFGIARGAQPSRYPLDWPDPDMEFLGYEVARVSSWYGPGVTRGTRELVSSVGRAAAALIALRTHRFVPTRAEAVRGYGEHIGDEWSDLVSNVHDACRHRWQHRVPEGAADRRELRRICEKVLPFENHALKAFRSYVIERAATVETDRRILRETLGHAVSWDRRVRDALGVSGP